jgi:hypothetical protein
MAQQMPMAIIEYLALYFDTSCIRIDKPKQHAYSGTLSCAILPQETIHITRLNSERKIVDRTMAAKRFRKMLNLDDIAQNERYFAK